MEPTIPLYTADGELSEWINERRMARLERLDLVQVVRHKKGHVARCVLRRRPGDPRPTRLADYLGTRYCFREHLENGGLCWRLRRLGRGDELRPAFLAVAAQCMVSK
jgi:hypothetical protein